MEGEQEKQKMRAAQEVLQKTLATVEQGNVGTKEVSDALSRVGQVLETEAESAPDRKSEKAVADMAKLVEAAEQIIVEKDVGDRLQRIAKEAELAQKEQEKIAKQTSISAKTKSRAQTNAQLLTNNFGALFQLIISSYEFRLLVLDFIKIARTVFLRSVKADDMGQRVERQWLNGKDPAEIAKDVANRTIDQIQTKEGKIELSVTDEELDVLQDDLLELFSLIARDPKYKEGISRLFDLSELIYEETEPLTEKLQEAASQPHTEKLQEETKELIAQFTGRESLERFVDRFRTLVKRLRDDEETKTYLKDLKSFILETRNPSLVKSEAFKQRTRELVERGRKLMDNLRYKPEVEDFLNASDELMENLKNDEFVSTLRERAGILLEDITYEDSQGNRQIDTQVVGNIQKVIVPVLADALKYIPIPKIEDANMQREYIVDNVVLCGYDIIPDNVYVHLESDSLVNIRELETESSKTRLVISLRNIRTELKDIKFYYKRKVFPKMEDSGNVTLRIGGSGATLTITFSVDQHPGDKAAKFTGGQVEFHIDDMDIEFDRATITHDILVPMITSLLKRNIIYSVERGVENSLGESINDIGVRLSDALIGSGDRISKQLESMTDSVKRGEFARKYRKRQEKLE